MIYRALFSTLPCVVLQTILVLPSITNSERDSKLLQEDLDNVIEWSEDNNMMLNESKFELISFKSSNRLPLISELPFYEDSSSRYITRLGNELEPVSSLRDLGIIISDDFTWSNHVTKITTKATQMASWVLSLFKNRGRAHMLVMYKSFVRSHLEFSCPLWNPHHIRDITQIEGVQRSFNSKIHGYQHLNYWARLSSLKL